MADEKKEAEQRTTAVPPPSPSTPPSSALTVFISGIALFSDGYNAQIIGYMTPVLSLAYPSALTPAFISRLADTYLIGEIAGMLGFGWGIDRVGRRAGIVLATLALVVGVVLATAANGVSETGMLWMMIVGRGVAGFGAGGEYPVCAASSTEAADEGAGLRRRRGLLVAMTTDFAVDLGFVAAGCAALAVLAAYNFRAGDAGVWRVCFGLGIVLPLVLLPMRLSLRAESSAFRRHAPLRTLPYRLVLARYWKPMLGTALAWFCYDFVTYPFGLFSSSILAQLNPSGSLERNIGFGTAVNCFYLPGCLVGGLLMDRIGRKQTMTLGFACWALLGFIIGGALEPIRSVLPLFIVLYGIFNALGEMGPGVATFVTAAESFPTPVRGHFVGLAAAVGKAGAAIGTQVFTPIQASLADPTRGVQAVFLIGAAFAALGGIISYTLIPDRARELEKEDTAFREYLAEKGFETEFGDARECEEGL